YEPLAIRYLLVSVRYRKQLNFTLEGLKEAKAALDRIKDFIFRLNTSKLAAGSNLKIASDLETAREQFEAALDDDLNTSGALGARFVLFGECKGARAAGELRETNRTEIVGGLNVVDERLAIMPPMEQLVRADTEVEALVARHDEARRKRDFA